MRGDLRGVKMKKRFLVFGMIILIAGIFLAGFADAGRCYSPCSGAPFLIGNQFHVNNMDECISTCTNTGINNYCGTNSADAGGNNAFYYQFHSGGGAVNDCECRCTCNYAGWGAWSACSKSCGGGAQTRINLCGMIQTQPCNTQSCCTPKYYNYCDNSNGCGGSRATSPYNSCNLNSNTACGAETICDTYDNNCDGNPDNGCDDDRDGYADSNMTCNGNFIDGSGVIRPCSTNSGDTNDADSAVNPATVWYQDLDLDGFGNPLVTQTGSNQPAGYILAGGDCNDSNILAYPGVPEFCGGAQRGIDNDCDGNIDEECAGPGITIVSPLPLPYYYGSSSVSFEISLNESGDSCSYSIGGPNSTMDRISEVNFTKTENFLGHGKQNVIFYCNDTDLWESSAEINFTLDLMPPEIYILSPGYLEVVGRTVLLRANIGDLTLNTSSVRYEIRNGSISGNILDSGFMSDEGAGMFNASFITNDAWPYDSSVPGATMALSIIVYASDNFGRDANASSDFVLDNNLPSINIISPADGGSYNSDFNMNVLVENHMLAGSSYNLQDSIGNSVQTNNTALSSTSFTWADIISASTLPEGAYTLTVNADDDAGNTNSETSAFNVDRTAPAIIILTPADGANYTNATQMLSILALDSASSIWYDWNGANYTYSGDTEITFNEGYNTIYAWANDSAGNVYQTSSTFFVDSIAPSVWFVDPTEASGSIYNRTNIQINASASDSGSGIATINIIVYNSTGQAAYSTVYDQDNSFMELTALPDDSYYFHAVVFDGLLNIQVSEKRNVTIDTMPPAISIDSPENGATYTQANTPINISITASDANLQAVWYFDGTDNIVYSPPMLDNFAEGANTMTAYANDSAGNINSASISFFVDTVGPNLTINSPAAGSYTDDTILIDITGDSDTSAIWYNWNGTNESYSGPVNVTFGEGAINLIIYANDSLGNTAVYPISFSTALERTILDSYIYGEYYPYNLSSEVTTTAVTNSWVNESTVQNLTTDLIAPITDSNIQNSTLTDVSTIVSCTVLNSAVEGGICAYTTIDPSNITESDVTGSDITDSNISYSNVTWSIVINSSIWYSNINGSYIPNSIIWYSSIFNSNITSSEIWYSNINSSNITDSEVWYSVITDSNILNSLILNSTISMSNITNSNVSLSNIADSSITDSVIYNSNITNSTVLRSTIVNSSIADSSITDSTIIRSDITNSTITNSTIIDSSVENSIITNSIIQNSVIEDSIIIDSTIINSTIINSTIINSTVTDSDVTNSYVEDAYIDNSTIINSQIINSSISDAIVIDATIIDNIIYNGTITSGGVTYNASEDGPANITEVVNFPPTANLAIPNSAYANSAVLLNGSLSSDPNIPGIIGDSLAYEFNFGDGANYTGTASEVNHTYTSSGTFTASLTVRDAFGLSDSIFRNITILNIPSPSSGGRGGSYWRRTYKITEQQLENGSFIDLRVRDRVQFPINRETHYAGAVRLFRDSASFEVWSNVQTATLGEGEISEFDITGNESVDVYIKLINISNTRARIYIKKGAYIAPAIVSPAIVQPIVTKIEERKVTITPEKAKGIAIWLVVLIILVLILIAAVLLYKYYYAKRKRGKKESVKMEADNLLERAGVYAEEKPIEVSKTRPIMERIYEYREPIGEEKKTTKRKAKTSAKKKR